jgi:glutamate/aspartate transport system substrate-binding protein
MITPVRLFDKARCRFGDKGDTGLFVLVPYRAEDFAALAAAVTPALVARHLGGLPAGSVRCMPCPGLGTLVLAVRNSLGGGVTASLALDAHGKTLSGHLLGLEVPWSEAPGFAAVMPPASVLACILHLLASIAQHRRRRIDASEGDSMSFVTHTAALGLVVLGLAAPAQAAELTGTLQKIKETNTIVLGVRDTSIPFSYIDDKQQYVGYAIDICMKIVDAIKKEIDAPKLEVKQSLVTSSNRIPLMANGTVDMECGSTTNNADRQKQVAFTNSHYLTASRFVAKKSSNIADIDGLKGKAVVSVNGTTNIVQLNQFNTQRKLGITVLTAKDVVEAFLMVETDRAAAFVMDDIILSALIAGSKDPAAYEINADAFSKPEPYGIMMRRNDPQFKALVDKATAELYASPEMMTIYTRWFQSPVPPKGLNYNVPLSPAMKYQYQHPIDSADPDAYKS